VLVTVLISCALTVVSLFVVQQSVRAEFRRQSSEAGRASVRSFQRINRQHETELLRIAALLSELPTLKAVMTTEHAATIQDASSQFWDLSGTDLFVLTGPEHERVLAVHGTSQKPSIEKIENSLLSTHRLSGEPGWWQNGAELFRVVEHPIIAGSGSEEHLLGTLIVGRLISNAVAQQIGTFAGSDIALTSSSSVVASTLDAKGKTELERVLAGMGPEVVSAKINIGGSPYEMSEVRLDTDSPTPLRCYILFPLHSSYAFLARLNRMILVLGVLVAATGALLVTVIARAMTVPLDRLVKAVRALATGDYRYSIEPGGSAEVAALAHDFTIMRHQLVDMQRRRLDAERLA
jgi:HAMP domain-containing protein